MATGRRAKLTFFEEQLLFELRAIRFAINDHSKNTGKWLAIVAQAAANPADNTADIKAEIAKYTAQLKTEADAFEDAAKTQIN